MLDDNGDLINVEFEFYDPNPNQFLSIKSLLNGYLDGLSYRSSELTEIILDQVKNNNRKKYILKFFIRLKLEQ